MSRGTWEHYPRPDSYFDYGTFTFSGRVFQHFRLYLSHVTSAVLPNYQQVPQHHMTNAGRLPVTWFRLFPLRSPLLRESHLLSLPKGTEMVQFPSFATCPMDSGTVTRA